MFGPLSDDLLNYIGPKPSIDGIPIFPEMVNDHLDVDLAGRGEVLHCAEIFFSSIQIEPALAFGE